MQGLSGYDSVSRSIERRMSLRETEHTEKGCKEDVFGTEIDGHWS
jgi:hypothetical protein